MIFGQNFLRSIFFRGQSNFPSRFNFLSHFAWLFWVKDNCFLFLHFAISKYLEHFWLNFLAFRIPYKFLPDLEIFLAAMDLDSIFLEMVYLLGLNWTFCPEDFLIQVKKFRQFIFHGFSKKANFARRPKFWKMDLMVMQQRREVDLLPWWKELWLRQKDQLFHLRKANLK